ncbi:MAG TPA: hypothetical protein VGD00_11860 [Solirubrobacteraceae bacterium]|jgi:hypothetical protein
MSRRGLRLVLAACAVSALWLLKDGFLDLGLGLLFFAPAILLALPLLAGRYVGAERLQGSPRRRPRGARRPSPSPLAPRARWRILPRGGVLIAASLAVRPPPLVLSGQ